jgi:hypothetical protein
MKEIINLLLLVARRAMVMTTKRMTEIKIGRGSSLMRTITLSLRVS